jgi:hypothetical protein
MVLNVTPPTRSGRLAFALAAGIAALAAGAVAQEKTDKPPKRDIFTPAPKAIAVEQAPVATGELQKQLDKAKAINELLAKSWKDNNLKPSDVTSDYGFVRRVYLDILGRIAKPQEVTAYVRDNAPGTPAAKRARLVRKLLTDKDYADEYAKNWANVWTVWLLTRSGNPIYHDQMRVWLEDQFEKNVPYRSLVSQLLTAKGKTNENGAVNYVLAHLGEAVPRNKQEEEGQFEMVPITSRTTRLFLGLQTQCVQCHDHPFNPDWKQNNFWGVNVFFRQVRRDGQPNMMRANRDMTTAAVLTLRDDASRNKDGLVYYEKRNGEIRPALATFLDGRKAPLDGKYTRREQLAEFVTSHENFAKAFVNRLWGHFLGRGLNEQPTVDDFGEHNKVVHPELLELLGKAFTEEANYDVKELIGWICSSDAYALSSVANNTNAKSETDVYFSRKLLKAMSPEQLFESLMVATQADAAATKEGKKTLKEEWMQKLVTNFGDDEGNEITFNGTIVQALLMMNGKEINAAIARKDKGPVYDAMRKVLKSGGGLNMDAVDHLYLAALNRRPLARDYDAVRKVATRGGADLTFYVDLYWTLLNTNEFILNH